MGAMGAGGYLADKGQVPPPGDKRKGASAAALNLKALRLIPKGFLFRRPTAPFFDGLRYIKAAKRVVSY